MRLLPSDDRDPVRGGNPRGISILDNETGVWIDDVATVVTLEEELGEGISRIPTSAGVEVLLETTLASGASELGVESVLVGSRLRELVIVPLDELPDEVRIHLFEGCHARRLA